MNHHECGPSSLYRRENCPGSMLAERGLPETTNEYAEEGTLLHVELWNDNRESLSADHQKLLSMADYALNAIASKYGVPYWNGERKYSLFHNNRVLTFGTVDCWGRGSDGSAVIVDFKFGFKEVEDPKNNPQLAAYAAAVAQFVDPKRVVACIIQPRVMGSKYTSYEFTQFDKIIERIAGIIDNCKDPDAPRHAGGWCQYCKAFNTCEKVDNMTQELTDYDTTQITVANADEMYEKASLVEKKIKAIKEECRRVADANGGHAGRLHIREKSGARYIPDLQKAFESVQDLLTVEEFLSHCSASIAKLEGTVARKLKDSDRVPTLIVGKEQFNELCGVKNKPSTKVLELKK